MSSYEMAEQNHCTERGRAGSVSNSDATGRPRRSVLPLDPDELRLVMPYELVDAKAKARLYREVGELMVARGFTADVPYWRRASDETISCLFIENYRSSYLFYISLGGYILGLGDKVTRRPKLQQMHMQARLSAFAPVTTSSPQIALKGNGTEDTNKMVDEALTAIRSVGLDILAELSSAAGTKRVLPKYGDMRWMIGPLLREKCFGSSSAEVRGALPIQEWEIAGSVNSFHKFKSNA